MTKMTKRDYFNELLKNYDLTEELKDFINHEIELLNKKNARDRKPTKNQSDNEILMAEILASMEFDKEYSITELQKINGLSSNQKTSALVTKLKNQGLVIRTEVKGKATFTRVA